MIDAGIPDKSIVLCRQQSSADNNDIAVCLIDDNEATLKRVKFYDGIMVLHPENKKMEDIIFKGKEQNRVKILGVAKKVLKNI
jgi:repressor LexA